MSSCLVRFTDLQSEDGPSELCGSSQEKNVTNDFKCDLCSQKFTLKDSVVRHLKNVHGVVSSKKNEECDEPRFYCEYCEKSYKHRKDLYHHIRTQHSGEYFCLL